MKKVLKIVGSMVASPLIIVFNVYWIKVYKLFGQQILPVDDTEALLFALISWALSLLILSVSFDE